MERTIDVLTQDALRLPADQRVTLAHRLLSSIEPKENVETLWDSEIQRRIKAYDEGKTTTIPASDVFEGITKRLAK
jgi:putative addiction module component (TIGR02574 family)